MRMPPPFDRSAPLMRILAVLHLLPCVACADGVWLGAGGGSWGLASNWLAADAPALAGEAGGFSSIDLVRDTVVTLDGSRVVGRLVFDDIAPSHEWVLRKGSGGSILLDSTSGSPEISVLRGNARIGAELTGFEGMTKTGNGTLILEGRNQWSGPLRVSAGVLKLGPGPSIPAGIKVMPMGDSITFGFNGTNSGYRGPLFNLLSPVAQGFQFTGASTINSHFQLPEDQRRHEGRSSYNIQDVYRNLDGFDNTRYLLFGGSDRDPHGGHWLTGTANRQPAYPDVITLMLGTNDLELQSGVETRYRNLIDKITTLRPGTRLLAAKIVPSALVRNGTNFANVVSNYNQIVGRVVTDFQALGRNVQLVDLHTRFPSNGLHTDFVHPVDAGFNWMAIQWHEAILRSYTPATGVSSGIPLQAEVTVDAGAKLDLAGNEASFAELSLSGALDLGNGGKLVVPLTRVYQSGNLAGGGTVKGTVVMHGSSLGTPGRELVFDGTVSNNSTIWMPPGSKVKFLSTFVNNGVMDVWSGSTLDFQGYLVNNGTLRITEGALLEVGGTIVNNGTLDIITGPQIPAENLINLGTILDADSVRMDHIEITQDTVEMQMQAYPGHIYQLQSCDNLDQGVWTDVGNVEEVTETQPIHFSAPRVSGKTAAFFRVKVSP